MTIEQTGSGVAPVDRSAVLLAELQAVCQRILAGDARRGGEGALAPTLIATANGGALASSLEALRRQCLDDNQQIVELKRSVDGLRAIMSGDSADNGTMLVELRRSVATMTEVLGSEQQQLAELVRSVESLRVGLAGFSANNRQQVSELRRSVQALEEAVTGVEARNDAAMKAVGAQVDDAVGILGRQVEGAVASLGGQVGTALRAMGEQITAALTTMAGQMQEAFDGFGQQVGDQMAEQETAFEALLDELKSQAPRDRLNELEQLLTVALPQFSEEIQAGVQQTLLAVSRTFRLAEREHGNRMAELHRDFDATARRLEAAIQPRRREDSVN